jgi:AraC family transcriptional regulator
MYFTRLPDPTDPGFDEALHYRRFKQENIIFNASSSFSYCHEHVGCLSLKTIFQGEETYTVDHQRLTLRPGHFLVLNNDQTYSSHIQKGEFTRILSVFFQKDFAASVFEDSLLSEESLLADPMLRAGQAPAFFSKLNHMDPVLGQHLHRMVTRYDTMGYDQGRATEDLVFLLRYLVGNYKQERQESLQVQALKASTRTELYRRLCIAKDLIHASFMDPLDLAQLSLESRMSVPQLVRQFKAVFGCTPHQYLITTRLNQAAHWLQTNHWPVGEITWRCGFVDPSAFCRAFKSRYGLSPEGYRTAHQPYGTALHPYRIAHHPNLTAISQGPIVQTTSPMD